MTTPPIPAALREAAYNAALNAPPCQHWAGAVTRATCIGCYVDAALTVALGVCEVREEWGYRSIWKNVPERYWHGANPKPDYLDNWSFGRTEEAVRHIVAEAGTVPRIPLRRLVIATPAEQVDTEEVAAHG